MFSYYTDSEKELLEQAAEYRRRSISSYVAEATLDRAKRDVPDWETRWPDLV